MVWVEGKYIAVSDGIHKLAQSSHDGLLRYDFGSRRHNVQSIQVESGIGYNGCLSNKRTLNDSFIRMQNKIHIEPIIGLWLRD